MSKKKPYFPNNWAEFKAAPDDMFLRHTFEEIWTWKATKWQLPSSIHCIIRYRERGSQRIKERVYQKPKHAENKVEKLISEGAEEITVCDPNTIHNLVREDDEYYYELG